MTTLYNCHHDGDQYRITKFTDGNPEGSYLCTHSECTCPAGNRQTCRHRQMLPEFLNRHLVNSHLFWDFDLRQSCDFQGNPARHTIALPKGPEVAPAIDDLYGTAPYTTAPQPHSTEVSVADSDFADGSSNPSGVAKPATPWRRL